MELKVSCCFIDNLQRTNCNIKLLHCYGIFLTSLNLTCTRMKKTLQSRNDSAHQGTLQKTPALQVWNGAGTLASPPPMPKQKTVVDFPLPHQSCSIVSERPSGKNCITQGPVHRFVSLINLLVPTWHKSPPEVIYIYMLSRKQCALPVITTKPLWW